MRRKLGNTHIALTIVAIIILFVLTNAYFATQNYNAKKEAEKKAVIKAFLDKKSLNCADETREADVSQALGWEYKDDDKNARFKKNGALFSVEQCKEAPIGK